MAAQFGRNVVGHPESTSGSPLVDAAVNTTTAHHAAAGVPSHSPTNSNSTIPHFNVSEPTNESVTPSEAFPVRDPAVPASSAGVARSSPLDTVPHSTHDPTFDASSTIEKHGSPNGDLVNGTQDDASQGEGPADDRSVDVSINSDTDNSRADGNEKKDGSHHAHTNSVRKPPVFSKITSTKNFLNKVAPSVPVALKVGEKPAPASSTTLLTSKPRLVAKTGASIANLQKSRAGPEGPGGPDASTVWNKNRPVAPPPPRQFTDEELKQQYGIHLATRLQTDEGGKESKWADIDDDEDDWAPETVVWMDGTKSSLAPQDVAPQQTEDKEEQKQPKPAPQQVPSSKPADGVRPTLALKQRSEVKILKPGGVAAQTMQDGATTSSPGSEKQLLKVKGPATTPAPAPAPAKSPWAAVPKVESISPVNPPVQQPPPPRTMPSQDARSYEQQAPPAREIATDTFDRSWREGEGGTRELFNSTNGRYEPAPEGRRSSVRQDSAYRKPAVLQRSAQGGPAEPSAAFQSRTTSQIDGSWGRRRGSSVSQGSSIPAGSHLSANQRPDLVQTPEGSQDTRSPQSTRVEPVQAASTLSKQSSGEQQMPPEPELNVEAAPMSLVEDQVKVQERVMREKREMAIRRRKEEEEKLETERKERLKAKLAALEGAGKSKKERDAEAAAAAAAATAASKETPTSRKPVELAPPTNKTAVLESSTKAPDESAVPASASASANAAPEAQTRAPTASVSDKAPPSLPSKPEPTGLFPDRSLSDEQTQRQTARGHLSPRAGARAPYQQQQSAPYKAPNSSFSSPGNQKPQPSFGQSPSLGGNAFTPWPSTAPTSNVWGSSGIGNGTFEGSSSFAPMQSSSLPPPPGMNRGGTASARISPQGFNQGSRSPSAQHQPVAEQQRAFPPPGIDPRPDPFVNQPRLNGMSPAPGAGRPVHPPGPIGPPSRTQAHQPPPPPPQQQPQQPQQTPVQRHDPLAAWHSTAQNLPNQFTRDTATGDDRRRQQPQPQPQQGPGAPAEYRYKETFKKTSTDQGKLGAPRKFETTEYTVHDAQGSRSVSSLSPVPPATQTQSAAPLPAWSPLQDPWKQAGDSQVRIPDGSRNPALSGLPTRQLAVAPSGVQTAAPGAYQGNARFVTAPIAPITETHEHSPPPPETDTHPVNQDSPGRPLVKLPPPQAKVKLPPKSPSSAVSVPVQQNTGSVLMPQRPYSSANFGPPGAATPIVQQQAWQARFNGLFNRTPIQTETPPSPPKTPPKMQHPSLAVASSSRAVMDVHLGGATVSLPQAKKARTPDGFTIDDSADIVSKAVSDELFDEQRSFGSMPVIRIPRNNNYNKEPYGPQAKNLLQFHSNSKLQKQIEPETRREPYFWRHPDGIFVTIPRTKFNNKLVTRTGAHERPKAAERKSGQNDMHEQQHRKPSGRYSKDKGARETSATDSHASTTPLSDEKRKSGPRRPSRQASSVPVNGESAPVSNDASKTDGTGSEKRKSGWASNRSRGTRPTSAAPSTPTPVKSS